MPDYGDDEAFIQNRDGKVIDIFNKPRPFSQRAKFDYVQKREKRIEAMFEKWAPIVDRIRRKAMLDPDMNKRETLAIMFFDLAMVEPKPNNIFRCLHALQKVYGHETSKIQHEDGTLETRMEEYRKQLMESVIDDITVMNGQVVIVQKPDDKKKLEAGHADVASDG